MDFFSIPILINNYNRLGCFQKQIEWLLKAGYYNIHVNDNCSTYQPLLEYYEHLKSLGIKVHIHNTNHGYTGFVYYPEFNLFQQGYFVTTDPDVIPNENAPKNIIEILYHKMQKYSYSKCGLALKIDDLPDHNPQKGHVVEWESQFWTDKLEEDVYNAPIDTTFALNAPNSNGGYSNALRIAGDCIAYHATWYLDPSNLPEDEAFYVSNLNKNSSYWSSKI